MTAAISVETDLWAEATNHLSERPEQVGFFLARYDPSARRFTLTHWRPLAEEELAYRSEYHVEITDEAKTEALKWATRDKAVLVEAHSHGRRGDPEFSYSDLGGFEDWVPHVRWRLRGAPYAAIVLAGEELDALAWIDDAPEQVETIEVTHTLHASGDTLARMVLREQRRRSHG